MDEEAESGKKHRPSLRDLLAGNKKSPGAQKLRKESSILSGNAMAAGRAFIDEVGALHAKAKQETTSSSAIVIAEIPPQPATSPALRNAAAIEDVRQANDQANEQANDRTSEQASEQTNEQTNEQADKQTGKQTSRQTGKQPDKQTSKQETEQTAEQTSKQEVGQTTGQLTKQEARQLTGQTTGQMIEQSTEQMGWQMTKQTSRQKCLLLLTQNQQTILDYLIQNEPVIMSVQALSRTVYIPYGTARAAISALEKEGYFSSKFYQRGRIKGTAFTLNEEKCQAFLEAKQAAEQMPRQTTRQTTEQTNRQMLGQMIEQTTGQAIEQASRQASRQATGQITGQTSKQANEQANDQTTPSKIDRKKNLSIYAQRLEELSEEDIRFYWPTLAEKGFTKNQITQIVEKLDQVGKEPEFVMQGLFHADWELENGRMRDKEGKEVASPVSWVFSSLARFGYYRRPEGYVSPEEQAKLDAENESKRLLEAAKRSKEVKFEAWKAGMSDEERQAILSTMQRKMPEEQFLRQHWDRMEGQGN